MIISGMLVNGEQLAVVSVYQTPLREVLPTPLREVLIACYVGTGCDYLSKRGAKLAALGAFPEQYLKDFENCLWTINKSQERRVVSQGS